MKLRFAPLFVGFLLLFLGSPSAANAQSCTGDCNLVTWPEVDPVWEFCWVPADKSSGANGSGLEIRDVKYKGRSVLKRGHAPILNVEYDAGGCGCFRDWMDEESVFQTDGVINTCYAEATPGTVQTKCDVGGSSDIGSFTGVASESFPDQLVLSTQTSAGWYRYTMRWRFFLDGRIQPEFAFATVSAPCVANTHNHHVYWRFDFDIEDPENDEIVETSDVAADLPFATETLRTWGDPADNVKWRVMDTVTGLGYEIVPGAEDFELPIDDFSKTDAFFTLYKPLEISDNSFQCAVQTNSLVNNESISGSDVVFWYRSGHRHLANEIEACGLGGPMLTPVGDWGQGDTGAMTFAVTPVNPVIEIPPEGGSFQYNLDVVNGTSASQTFDLWLAISGPGVDRTIGPVTRTLAAGASLNRTMTQNIPGGAPAGSYTYTGSLGTFPIPDQTDSFTFEKLAGAAKAGPSTSDWLLMARPVGQPLAANADWTAALAAADPSSPTPTVYSLEQNYPNPFSETTRIRYAVRDEAHVRLAVYNALGQEVRVLVDGPQAAGFRSVSWDSKDHAGADLPSGRYFYKLVAGDYEQTKMMILLK